MTRDSFDVAHRRKVIMGAISSVSHLMIFVLVLGVAVAVKWVLERMGVRLPPLAAWEMAALIHVYLVAQKVMDFRGFEFASKKFNSRFRRWVVNGVFVFMFLKLATIIVETHFPAPETVREIGAEPVSHVSYVAESRKEADGHGLAGVLVNVIEGLSPYILVLPLFYFLGFNWYALTHVTKQAREFGLSETDQELYLKGLIKFVDVPVTLPFVVMFVYLKWEKFFDAKTEALVFGVIGCSLLIVSNLLTGVFDEHWAQIRKRELS